MNIDYFLPDDAFLQSELLQCEHEGRDLEPLREAFQNAMATDRSIPENRDAALALLDESIKLPLRTDYDFTEPSDLAGIRAARPADVPVLKSLALSDSELEDKLYGGWAGRSAGCLLGKPIEGWKRKQAWTYLKELNRWPLNDYFRYDAITPEYQEAHPEAAQWDKTPFIDRIEPGMPEDDDLNYTVTGMAILQRHGKDFTPTDVANFWLNNIPAFHTFTAERVAYRNFLDLISPPCSATFRNPYREWIGAQIRADFFGYICPGDPERAAEFAFRDASISHVKNGIYGEMWAAAMIAAAYVESDIPTIIRAGLAQIPENCRLASAIEDVLEWVEVEVDYDTAVYRLHELWNEERAYDWCHTIPNAMIVAMGLLYGEGDYEKSICRAVQPCFDTDCNGATVGSIMGVVLGRKALPDKWIAPLQDTLHTGIDGFHKVQLADLTRDSLKILVASRA